MSGLDQKSEPAKPATTKPITDARPFGLQMGYENMWSLLDGVSTEDMQKEIDRFTPLKAELVRQEREIESRIGAITRKTNVLKEVVSKRMWAKTIEEFVLTDEHKALVRLIDFSDMSRPPKLYYDDEEIAEKLGWQKPNEYVSDEQTEKIAKLKYELPLAIDQVIGLVSTGVKPPQA